MHSAEPAREEAAERPTAVPEAAPAGAPQRLLDLQRTAGNRAVGRLLARQTPTDVEVKKRFDLPVHSYSQDQVRALYLGIGIVYSGDAVWDPKSASWIVDRGNVISMPGIGRGGGGGDDLPSQEDLDRYESILDDILRSETLPGKWAVTEHDDFSTAHLNAVKASINYYILKAYRSTLDDTGSPDQTLIYVLKLAGKLVTIDRQSSELRSRSLILRDVQRYFYGRIAAWANVDAMKAASATGLFPTISKDPLIMSEAERAKAKEAPFRDDPDPKNIEKMKALQQDYETIKQVGKFFYMDMKASQYPSSAPGGRYWLEKGTVDSYNDMSKGTYKVKTVPYLVK